MYTKKIFNLSLSFYSSIDVSAVENFFALLAEKFLSRFPRNRPKERKPGTLVV